MTINSLKTSGKTLAMIADIVNRTPEPETPCHICGARDWWFRLPTVIFNAFTSPDAWICGKCHPMPGAVPPGDIIVAGHGKERAYTVHRDGSSSCRWFPDKDILESKNAPVVENRPAPEPVKIVKNESEETMKKQGKEKAVKRVSGTDEPRRKGRPALNIDSKTICDALKKHRDVKKAAASLGCSRGYIYKVVGADKVQKIVKSLEKAGAE